jgi:hypothetical protein
MRTALVCTMVTSFLWLGVLDLMAGHIRLGLIGVLLGIVQALIFWQ